MVNGILFFTAVYAMKVMLEVRQITRKSGKSDGILVLLATCLLSHQKPPFFIE